MGFMGSGKSAVGAAVAGRALAPFRDLDRLIEAEAGMPVARIFAAQGEAAFRGFEKRLLVRALEPGVVCALGGGAVVDDESWSLVASRAFSVYLQVPFNTLWVRIHDQPNRPLIAGRSREAVESLFEARRVRYEQAQASVDGDRPVETVADEVLQLWSA